MTEDRKTFAVPEGYEAVRDKDGRVTGEVRPIVDGLIERVKGPTNDESSIPRR